MKKFIYFFICVTFIVMVSCKQAAGVGVGNAGVKNNNLLEKEKKQKLKKKNIKMVLGGRLQLRAIYMTPDLMRKN